MCEEHREDDGENSRQRGHRGGYGIDNTDNGRLVMLSFAAVSIPREREAGKQGWYSEIDQLCSQ